jgi:hypothetical protein
MNILNIVLLILVVSEIGLCALLMRRHYRQRQKQDPRTRGRFDWQDQSLWVIRSLLYGGILFLLGLVFSFVVQH